MSDAEIRVPADVEPLDALAELAALERATEPAIDEQLIRARQAGATWQQIGQTMGVTKQAARQRHNRALKRRGGT